jgi:hypothetical protein
MFWLRVVQLKSASRSRDFGILGAKLIFELAVKSLATPAAADFHTVSIYCRHFASQLSSQAATERQRVRVSAGSIAVSCLSTPIRVFCGDIGLSFNIIVRLICHGH